jgi:hypothetical protein
MPPPAMAYLPCGSSSLSLARLTTFAIAGMMHVENRLRPNATAKKLPLDHLVSSLACQVLTFNHGSCCRTLVRGSVL